MLGRVVRWSLERPRLIAWACLWLTILGLLYVHDMKIELMPAIDPAQATVDTEAPGLVAGQVEATVTRPIEAALLGTPGVARVESRSVQGLSILTLHFVAGADPVRVRQSVTENLGRVGQLPVGTSPPRLSPLIAPGAGVMKIGFSGAKSPIELRQIVQWLVRPRLLSTPGVARVAIYGGQIPRIEVRARPADLSDSDLGFLDIVNAVRRATSVAGAGFIDTPNQRVLIEPHGQAETLDEVKDGQIQTPGNDPVRIDDVADVSEAAAPSYGDALIAGQPAVIVVVSQSLGANTLDATHAVEQTLAVLRPSLAAQGITIRTDLDRPASFISRTAAHIAWSLGIGVILAGIALFIFMRDVRVVLVTLVSVPLTFLVTLMALKAFGFTLNVMTLGGLAVAVGLIIDDAVIDVESILSDLVGVQSHDELRRESIVTASLEVRAPVFYATLALVAALVPLLFVSGPGEALLASLALTIVIASLSSLLVALTVTPALALLLFRDIQPGPHIAPLERLKVQHAAWLGQINSRPWLFMTCTVAVMILALATLLLFHAELVPPVHDGHIVASTDAPVSTSPAAVRATGHATATDIAMIYGVRTVSQEIGRDPTVDDAAGLEHGIVDVDLAPGLDDAAQARVARDVQHILARYTGGAAVTNSRFDAVEASGGMPSLRIGVLGQDLDAVDRTAQDVARTLVAMPGGVTVEIPSTERAPAVRIDLNFAKLALFGLSASDVLETVQAAFAGEAVAQIYQGSRVEDLVIIGQNSLRQDPEAVGNLLLRSNSGFAVPLRSVANVYLTESRAVIEHDGGIPRQLVTVVPRSNDIDGFARAARTVIDAEVKTPPGVFVTYELANSAAQMRHHLALAYTLGLFGVFAFLALVFDGPTAALILLSSGFSFIGGAFAIALNGGVLSIGPLAGLAALLGLSTRSAILMISQAENLVLERGAPWSFATVRHATTDRFVAIIGSAALVILALAPLALRASAAGMEILGPMAIVIIAGVVVGAIGDLVVLPIMLWRVWQPRGGQASLSDEGPQEIS
jgi:Cu/Ag efflux pump CusA